MALRSTSSTIPRTPPLFLLFQYLLLDLIRECHLPIKTQDPDSSVFRLEPDSDRTIPAGFTWVKGTAAQVEQPLPHISSETLNAISAKNVTTRQDMLWNLAHAAEASDVALQVRHPAQSRQHAYPSVEFRHHFSMQLHDAGCFFPIHRVIFAKPLIQCGDVLLDLGHPLWEELFLFERPFETCPRHYPASNELMTFLVRAQNVEALAPVPLKGASEPLNTELIVGGCNGTAVRSSKKV